MYSTIFINRAPNFARYANNLSSLQPGKSPALLQFLEWVHDLVLPVVATPYYQFNHCY